METRIQSTVPAVPFFAMPDEQPNIFGTTVRNLPFIEANTHEVDMRHLREDCIIPVFSKDNEVGFQNE